jgi:hypothetical protein
MSALFLFGGREMSRKQYSLMLALALVAGLVGGVISSQFLLCESALAVEQEIRLRTTPITELGARINVNSKSIFNISMKLLLLEKSDKPAVRRELLEGINNLQQSTSDAASILDSVGLLVIMIPHIEREYRPIFAQLTVSKIDTAYKTIKLIQRLIIEDYYSKPEYEVILSSVGDCRKLFQESLQLLSDAKKALTSPKFQ